MFPVVVKVPAVGKVTLVFADIVNVVAKPPIVLNIDESASHKVAPVDAAVKNILFILVAVATPKTGVTKVGVLANTNAPEPVSSEMTPAS